MSHLLVTNDFPPKIGGIQSYLYELWRRLPPDDVTVLTTAYPGASRWDAAQPFRVERVRAPFLAPIPGVCRRIDKLAAEVGAGIVLLDPAWPLGSLGPGLAHPFGLVLHGAEVTVPARLPGVQLALRRSLRAARLVVAAGAYPAEQGRFSAGRPLPTAVVPPGVDVERFRPADASTRWAVRRRLGVGHDTVVVLGVSRLVRRKGFDVLTRAAAHLADSDPDADFVVLVAGSGRDRPRLDGIVQRHRAPVRFLGRVPDAELPDLYAAADVFAMLCRDRWAGLEQEGFGIVFLEAAACGLPSLAGASGGSADAVVHGETGFVVEDPRVPDDVSHVLGRLVRDGDLRRRLGDAACDRARREFSYDVLAGRLAAAIADAIGSRDEHGAGTARVAGAGQVAG